MHQRIRSSSDPPHNNNDGDDDEEIEIDTLMIQRKTPIEHQHESSEISNANPNSPLASVTHRPLQILPGTPADAAIQAQAQVRVTKVKKLARFLNAQSVGRILRHGVLLLPSSGNKRGKPPRVPDDDDDNNNSIISYHHDHHHNNNNNSNDSDSHSDNNKQKHSLQQVEHKEASSWEDDDDDDDDGLSLCEDSQTFHDCIQEPSIDMTLQQQQQQTPVVSPTVLSRASSATSRRRSPLKIRFSSVLSNESLSSSSSSPLRLSKNKSLRTNHTETIINQGIAKPAKEYTTSPPKRRHKKHNNKLAKDRKSYVKGKVIDRQHELYALSIAMMLGLRTSIGVTHAKIQQPGQRNSDTWLSHPDFRHVEKYEFKPSGGPMTPPHQLAHTFKVKGYSPIVFAYLRRLFGINERDFLLSVCGRASYIEFISNAKSGQFFFYSHDGKFMIKTMTNAESKFLRRILPHYFQHCVQNPNTMITKFLGMYRVKMYHLQRKVKFIIMNSVFDTDKVLQSFFDLKGSSLGREAKPGQAVKKDNDVRKGFPDTCFSLLPDVKTRMRYQLTQDLDFLKRMKIMDYSMLIGVHHIPCVHQTTNTENPSSILVSGLNFRDPETRVKQRTHIDKNCCNDPDQMCSSPTMINHGQQRVHQTTRSRQDSSNMRRRSSLEDPPTGKDEKKISPDKEYSDSNNFEDSVKEKDGIVEENLVRSVLGAQTYESYSTLDEYSTGTDDDDNSVLEDHGITSSMNQEYSSGLPETGKVDCLEHLMAEDMYWPFQRYYTFKGRRRLHPRSNDSSPSTISTVSRPEISDGKKATTMRHRLVTFIGFHDKFDHGSELTVKEDSLTVFVPPLSNRKDGGFVMNTVGCEIPFKINAGNVIQYCDGKIFYMGIIDVLQQFNVRKRLEARFRRFKGGGWEGASCVHPSLYADRFLRFFDEYTASRGNKDD